MASDSRRGVRGGSYGLTDISGCATTPNEDTRLHRSRWYGGHNRLGAPSRFHPTARGRCGLSAGTRRSERPCPTGLWGACPCCYGRLGRCPTGSDLAVDSTSGALKLNALSIKADRDPVAWRWTAWSPRLVRPHTARPLVVPTRSQSTSLPAAVGRWSGVGWLAGVAAGTTMGSLTGSTGTGQTVE